MTASRSHRGGPQAPHRRWKNKYGQLWLDAGCGSGKTPGAVGMDRRKLDGVDVVHDIEVLPWPFPDSLFDRIILSHVMEHLNPKLHVDLMNEMWRVMKPNGQLLLAMPYPGSFGHWQDPTHIKPWNEATPQYFDPDKPLYQIYQPKPWKIVDVAIHHSGNIEIRMEKRNEKK